MEDITGYQIHIMNLKDFAGAQQQALLDLVMLAMYSDGHLAAAEDERVQRLLTAMGFATEHDRNKQYDTSVSRVSRHSSTAAAVKTHAVALAKNFATREQQRRVHDVLDDLIGSDSHISTQENAFLSVVREALQV
jgi:hypothetical protein